MKILWFEGVSLEGSWQRSLAVNLEIPTNFSNRQEFTKEVIRRFDAWVSQENQILYGKLVFGNKEPRYQRWLNSTKWAPGAMDEQVADACLVLMKFNYNRERAAWSWGKLWGWVEDVYWSVVWVFVMVALIEALRWSCR